MSSLRLSPRLCVSASKKALALLPVLLASIASATSPEILLQVGRGIAVDCPNGISRVATSSPEVVDAVVAGNQEVLFQAKALGQATLFIWSKQGERTAYNVTVEPNLDPIRRLLRETFPTEDIDIRATRESLSLIGKASSQAVADRALALIAASVKGAVSNISVAPPPAEKQIVLHVRFAELNRTAVAEFGVNILSTGTANTIGRITTGQFQSGSPAQLTGSIPGTAAGATSTFALSDVLNIFAFRPDLNLAALIRDLEHRGLLQVLAEPNLVATNGKEASFLAGGEFPVPVAQGGSTAGAISVQYHDYGIKLAFLPQVTSRDTIRLHVKPEVSSIDAANGVTMSGFNIPALSTRRMETDIELTVGQSFAIGGLIDDRVIQNLSTVPGLAHIPILGALFRSRSVTKSKTELIVVVTPELVGTGANSWEIPMPVPFLPPATKGTPDHD